MAVLSADEVVADSVVVAASVVVAVVLSFVVDSCATETCATKMMIINISNVSEGRRAFARPTDNRATMVAIDRSLDS